MVSGKGRDTSVEFGGWFRLCKSRSVTGTNEAESDPRGRNACSYCTILYGTGVVKDIPRNDAQKAEVVCIMTLCYFSKAGQKLVITYLLPHWSKGQPLHLQVVVAGWKSTPNRLILLCSGPLLTAS